MPKVHVALFTPGYPYVDAVVRAVDLARAAQGSFSRSIGEPLGLQRDQFVRWLLRSDATHALLLEGDIVPPPETVDRLLEAQVPVATAVYPQWVEDRLCTSVQLPGCAAWAERVPASRFAIARCLLGCVLVHRDVFVAIGAPWFLATMTATRYVSDDEWFCAAVARAGLAMACDGRVTCAAIRQGANLLALTGGSIHAA